MAKKRGGKKMDVGSGTSQHRRDHKVEGHAAVMMQVEQKAVPISMEVGKTASVQDVMCSDDDVAAKKDMDFLRKQHAETEILLVEARSKYRDSCERYARMKGLYIHERERAQLSAASLDEFKQKYAYEHGLVDRLASSISFQLGEMIVRAAKEGIGGVVKLPLQLMRLANLARKRKKDGACGLPTRLLNVDVRMDLVRQKRTESVTLAAAGGGKKDGEELATREVAPAIGPIVLEYSKPLFKLGATQTAHRLGKMKVAAIMDDFTFHSYAPECQLLQLTPAHWRQELDAFEPDMLFIESAWRGKKELWKNKVGKLPKELLGILEWCRERNIPTAFWNKEDPIHFETFLNVARNFDFVFTTDMDCVSRYKNMLAHDRVYFLPFAAQSQINNPIEIFERKDAISFAGAYYVRYPERTRDLEDFIDTLPEYRPVEIFDRNYGKDDPNYMFPDRFTPYIVGTLPFSEIDRAYKGYRYAINLNSVKNSQTMFARRIYELLASGTTTLSNYSRGVRLMFGDLVVCSDSGQAVKDQLRIIDATPHGQEKHRVKGVRKIFREHTYQDRLAYVASKMFGDVDADDLWPEVCIVAWADTAVQAKRILQAFRRQEYTRKRLVMYASEGCCEGLELDEQTEIRSPAQEAGGAFIAMHGWVSIFHADDYHGPHYISDLMAATRYSDATVVGKAGSFRYTLNEGLVVTEGATYSWVDALLCRASVIHSSLVSGMTLAELRQQSKTGYFRHVKMLAADRFGYCLEGATLSNLEISEVDADDGVNEGLSLASLIKIVEKIEADKAVEGIPEFPMQELSGLLNGTGAGGKVKVFPDVAGLLAQSDLEIGSHHYQYAQKDVRVSALDPVEGKLTLHFETRPGLDMQFALIFFDEEKQRISHSIINANKNCEVSIPEGACFIRMGLRISGPGEALINHLWLKHTQLVPARMLGTGEHLILTNHYPSYDDIYRNGFVHGRVKAYRLQGSMVDVMRLREGEAPTYHKFETVECLTGGTEVLDALLASGQYKSVLIHFLEPSMWEVVKKYQDRLKVVVWIHGAEIQPLHRREYNYQKEDERKIAQLQSDQRMAFWRDVFRSIHDNVKFVFVSRYFAEEVMEDIGFRLPGHSYEVIHNPIDTDIFNYVEKPEEQRFRLLSIRPYASRKYANDLSVMAILELAKESWFSKLEIVMIGDGALFDEVLEPLRGLKNVIIQRGFLTQKQIAMNHKGYGIFLCPTRMDAQGVSRDEAMASGLVPVSNAVTAIPEFVDDDCGILTDGEDYLGMAQGIARLVQDPQLFARLSRAAADRVLRQSSSGVIIRKELGLFECNSDQ